MRIAIYKGPLKPGLIPGGEYPIEKLVQAEQRYGSLSPTNSYLVLESGRHLTWYEQQVWWNIDLSPSDWLYLLYSEAIFKEMLYEKNPFLELISKEDSFAGAHYPIPTLYGKE